MEATCGVIMPISSIDGCTEEHWSEVREILFDAIRKAGFRPNLVSDSEYIGVIHKRIIMNLFDNPIVVCDVSGRNPNVMFELGMRLAFDKPTILVKDEVTNFSFDTAPIEHLVYRRDLKYQDVLNFKEKLSIKISNAYEKSTKDKNFATFLNNFGEFKIVKLDTIESALNDIVLDEIKELKQLFFANQRIMNKVASQHSLRAAKDYDGIPWNYQIACQNGDLEVGEEIANIISVFPSNVGVCLKENKSTNGFNIFVHSIEEAPSPTFKKVEKIVDVYAESMAIGVYTGY
jgi:hypothetical protein